MRRRVALTAAQAQQKIATSIPTDPLTQEASIRTLQPTSDQMRERMMEIADEFLASDKLTPREKKGISLWKAHMLAGTIRSTVTQEFVQDFQLWLLGRGKDKDHGNTPWGRKSLAHLEDVSAYVDTFPTLMQEFRIKIQLLAMNAPTNVYQAYLYFKYVVRGLNSSHNVNQSTFLDDWNLLIAEFDDAREHGQEWYAKNAEQQYSYPWETAPYDDRRGRHRFSSAAQKAIARRWHQGPPGQGGGPPPNDGDDDDEDTDNGPFNPDIRGRTRRRGGDATDGGSTPSRPPPAPKAPSGGAFGTVSQKELEENMRRTIPEIMSGQMTPEQAGAAHSRLQQELDKQKAESDAALKAAQEKGDKEKAAAILEAQKQLQQHKETADKLSQQLKDEAAKAKQEAADVKAKFEAKVKELEAERAKNAESAQALVKANEANKALADHLKQREQQITNLEKNAVDPATKSSVTIEQLDEHINENKRIAGLLQDKDSALKQKEADLQAERQRHNNLQLQIRAEALKNFVANNGDPQAMIRTVDANSAQRSRELSDMLNEAINRSQQHIDSKSPTRETREDMRNRYNNFRAQVKQATAGLNPEQATDFLLKLQTAQTDILNEDTQRKTSEQIRQQQLKTQEAVAAQQREAQRAQEEADRRHAAEIAQQKAAAQAAIAAENQRHADELANVQRLHQQQLQNQDRRVATILGAGQQAVADQLKARRQEAEDAGKMLNEMQATMNSQAREYARWMQHASLMRAQEQGISNQALQGALQRVGLMKQENGRLLDQMDVLRQSAQRGQQAQQELQRLMGIIDKVRRGEPTEEFPALPDPAARQQTVKELEGKEKDLRAIVSVGSEANSRINFNTDLLRRTINNMGGNAGQLNFNDAARMQRQMLDEAEQLYLQDQQRMLMIEGPPPKDKEEADAAPQKRGREEPLALEAPPAAEQPQQVAEPDRIQEPMDVAPAPAEEAQDAQEAAEVEHMQGTSTEMVPVTDADTDQTALVPVEQSKRHRPRNGSDSE